MCQSSHKMDNMRHKRIIKKKRSENWDDEEKELLIKCVKEKFLLINDKRTDNRTNLSKKRAWNEIMLRFNKVNRRHRDVNRLQSQWSVMKMSLKKKVIQSLNAEGNTTLPLDLSGLEMDIMSLLEPEFSCIQKTKDIVSPQKHQETYMSNENNEDLENSIDNIVLSVIVKEENTSDTEMDGDEETAPVEISKPDGDPLKSAPCPSARETPIYQCARNSKTKANIMDSYCREQIQALRREEIQKRKYRDECHSVQMNILQLEKETKQRCLEAAEKELEIKAFVLQSLRDDEYRKAALFELEKELLKKKYP